MFGVGIEIENSQKCIFGKNAKGKLIIYLGEFKRVMEKGL